ncbi:conserved domain protein [Verrucomicrobiia bacterium DG1235]|nr:conserved domain protein [Verrucomicrobiae bacterium DG1235]
MSDYPIVAPLTIDLMKNSLTSIAAAIAIACLPPLSANVSLPGIFTNNMVLQQDTEVALWGWADPGESVSIAANWSESATTSATADSNGKWTASLVTPPAPSAQTGYTLTFTATNTITLSDVLLGEVWLLGGQSNMALPLSGWSFGDPPAPVSDGAAAIAAANYPNIRLIVVGENSASEPEEDITPHWALASWTKCSPSNVGNFSAIGYWFGERLLQDLSVPIGLIQAPWSGSSCEAWLPAADLERVANYRGQGPFISTGNSDNQTPSVNYNGMIAPIVPFTIAGALWYQGETNMGRAEELSQLFPQMITAWRNQWKQGDFPFYFAQLAPYDDYWQLQLPEFWEAQASALHLPNTGLVTTIDVGDAENIHPGDKAPIAHRFAQLALARAYGQTGFIASSPLYRSTTVVDNSLHLSFDYADGGLVAAEDGLVGFEIASENGTFDPATATIDGETLILASESVPEPTQARYAWARVPTPSLFNADGLPVAPFRTQPASYVFSNYGNPVRSTIQSNGTLSSHAKLYDSEDKLHLPYGATLDISASAPDFEKIQQIAENPTINSVTINWVQDSFDDISAQAISIEKLLTTALAFDLLPTLSLDLSQGQAATLGQTNNFWTNPIIADLAKRYQREVAIQIYNGATLSDDDDWKALNKVSIVVIRMRGIKSLITIEAPVNVTATDLITAHAEFLSSDNLKNILITLQPTADLDAFEDLLDAAIAAQIPVIVRNPTNASQEVTQRILQACAERRIGYTTTFPTELTIPSSFSNLAHPSPAAQTAFTYNNWSQRIDWQSHSSEPEADPDADSLDNQTEHLLGLDPLLPNDKPEPLFSKTDSRLTITYPFGPTLKNVPNFQLRASQDLETWVESANATEFSNPAINKKPQADGTIHLELSTTADTLFTEIDL